MRAHSQENDASISVYKEPFYPGDSIFHFLVKAPKNHQRKRKQTDKMERKGLTAWSHANAPQVMLIDKLAKNLQMTASDLQTTYGNPTYN